MKISKYLKGFFISAIITVTIISLMIGFTGINENLDKIKTFSIKFAFYSMGVIIIKWVIETIILKISLFNEGKKISYFKILKGVVLGQFFNNLTPFYTGGQPVQIYYLSKNDINPSIATASILYKSMVFQIVMSIMGIIGFFYSIKYLELHVTIMILIGIILNGFTVFLILFFSLNEKLSKKMMIKITMFLKKIKVLKNPEEKMHILMEKVEDFVSFFKENSKKVFKLILVFILTFFQFSIYLTTLLFVFKGFNIPISINLFFKSLILNISSSIIPTPGTAGGAEGFFYLIFSNVTDIFTLNSTVIIWRLTTFYFILFVGFILFLIMMKRKNIKK